MTLQKTTTNKKLPFPPPSVVVGCNKKLTEEEDNRTSAIAMQVIHCAVMLLLGRWAQIGRRHRANAPSPQHHPPPHLLLCAICPFPFMLFHAVRLVHPRTDCVVAHKHSSRQAIGKKTFVVVVSVFLPFSCQRRSAPLTNSITLPFNLHCNFRISPLSLSIPPSPYLLLPVTHHFFSLLNERNAKKIFCLCLFV